MMLLLVRSFLRKLRGCFRFRTAGLMVAIALFALAMTAVREYLRPERVWRRGVHAHDPIGRTDAWNEARSGRIDGLDRQKTVEEVGRALEDDDSETAARAVQVYPLIQGDPAEVARRLALRLIDGDPRVRRVAANTIRYAVHPQGDQREIVVLALITALDDPDAEVRRLAARSLGEVSFQVGHSDSFDPRPALRRKLGDSDDAVRVASALALTYDGAGEEVVPMLLETIAKHTESDRNCPVTGCAAAFEALMVLAPRSDQATSGLIARVYREKYGRSGETLTTLAAVINRDGKARARLVARSVEALEATNPDLRLSACLVLDRIGEGRRAIPALVQTLDRGSQRVRPYVTETLTNLALAESPAIRQAALDPTLREESREFLRSLVGDGPMP